MHSDGVLEFNRYEGDLTWSDGTISPGIDRTPSLVEGDLELESGGTLLLEVGGTAGSNDALSVGGLANFEGALAIRIDNGFVPDPNQTFPVLSAASIIGVLDNVGNGQRLMTVDGTGSFVVNYGAASAFDADRIVLSDFEAIDFSVGDVNRDGEVNLSDIAAFVEVLSAGFYQTEADINQDGTVNLQDVPAFVELLSS